MGIDSSSFHGEDAASIAATRGMIVHMNDGFAAQPPVLHYIINPVIMIDFAAVSHRKEPLEGAMRSEQVRAAGADASVQSLLGPLR